MLRRKATACRQIVRQEPWTCAQASGLCFVSGELRVAQAPWGSRRPGCAWRAHHLEPGALPAVPMKERSSTVPNAYTNVSNVGRAAEMHMT